MIFVERRHKFERMVHDPSHARISYERLMLQQPHLDVRGLWERAGMFYVHCPALASERATDGQPIATWFQKNRIICARVALVAKVPEGAVPVPERTIDEIARLEGEVRTMADLTRDLAIALPKNFPLYELRDGEPHFQLHVSRALSASESETFRTTMHSLGAYSPYEVVVDPAFAPMPFERQPSPLPDLGLVPSRLLPSKFASAVRRAWEADEDTWLASRANVFAGKLRMEDVLPKRVTKRVSRCLVDARFGVAANIRAFVPIYAETALVLPTDRMYAQALDTLQVSEDELVELARRGRLTFIAPQSIDRYPSSLLNKVVESAPDAIVFTRVLASATVLDARRRLPLLYPPFGMAERRALISMLARKDDVSLDGDMKLRDALLDWTSSNWGYAERLLDEAGAMGTLSVGLGSLVGATFKALRGEDLTMEFESAAGPVEWAGVLGATVFPLVGDGYSAEGATEMCASLYSGVPMGTPAAALGQVSTIVDGVLTLDGDASILDVADAFSGDDLERLRAIVLRIARENLDEDFLREALEKLNARVTSYDKNVERLQRMNMVGLATALTTGLIAAGVIAPAAAPILPLGAWLLNAALVGYKPSGEKLGRAFDAVRGVNALTGSDAVLVSRLRKRVKGTK